MMRHRAIILAVLAVLPCEALAIPLTSITKNYGIGSFRYSTFRPSQQYSAELQFFPNPIMLPVAPTGFTFGDLFTTTFTVKATYTVRLSGDPTFSGQSANYNFGETRVGLVSNSGLLIPIESLNLTGLTGGNTLFSNTAANVGLLYQSNPYTDILQITASGSGTDLPKAFVLTGSYSPLSGTPDYGLQVYQGVNATVSTIISPTIKALDARDTAQTIAEASEQVAALYKSISVIGDAKERDNFTKGNPITTDDLQSQISRAIVNKGVEKQSDYSAVGDFIKSIIEVYLAKSEAAVVTSVASGLSAVFEGISGIATRYVNDPANQNYKSPVVAKIATIDQGDNVSSQQRSLLNEGLRYASLAGAVIESFERYQGAFLAGDYDNAAARMGEYILFRNGLSSSAGSFMQQVASDDVVSNTSSVIQSFDNQRLLDWLQKGDASTFYQLQDLAPWQAALDKGGISSADVLALLNRHQTSALPVASSGQLAQAEGNLAVGLKGFSATLGSPLGGPSASAVPESTTWGMMIAGFALTGCSMRRRRERVAVRFA